MERWIIIIVQNALQFVFITGIYISLWGGVCVWEGWWWWCGGGALRYSFPPSHVFGRSHWGTYHFILFIIQVGSNEISYHSNVWITLFGVNTTICLDILEGIIHQTSIATQVSKITRTINQVLFTETDQVARFLFMLPFQWTSLK